MQPNASTLKGKCPTCGKWYRLDAKGRVRVHQEERKEWDTRSYKKCLGSRKIPTFVK